MIVIPQASRVSRDLDGFDEFSGILKATRITGAWQEEWIRAHADGSISGQGNGPDWPRLVVTGLPGEGTAYQLLGWKATPLLKAIQRQGQLLSGLGSAHNTDVRPVVEL